MSRSEEYYDKVLSTLGECLHKDEVILAKSPVGRKGSFYVAVFRDKYYYKVLRFSDHKAAVPYLAIPTIDYTVSRSILRARIEKALNEPWVRFTFESFYALKVIEKWAEHRVSIFYERAYKQKKYHKHSFYLIEDYALEGKRIYLSEHVSKELRRLLATGMLNIRRGLSSQDAPLYMTPLSTVFSHYFDREYGLMWKEKERQISWQLPNSDSFEARKRRPKEDVKVAYQVDVSQLYPTSSEPYYPTYLYQAAALPFWRRLWQKICQIFNKKKQVAEEQAPLEKTEAQAVTAPQDKEKREQKLSPDDVLLAEKKRLEKYKKSTHSLKDKAIKKRHMIGIETTMSAQSLEKLQALKDSLAKEDENC